MTGDAPAAVLDPQDVSLIPPAARRRLTNQITRAYRGTFGASVGLATIVKSVALQMLQAGVSRPDVVAALEDFLIHHPACVEADAGAMVTGKLHSSTLVALARQSVADLFPEPVAR